MMRQTLLLAILHSQLCRGFVFSPSSMDNSVEDIPIEYSDESIHFAGQDFMEQKTENEFDDKVHLCMKSLFSTFKLVFLDRKRDYCIFFSLFCCIKPVWE